jgi:hypothetical protein
MSIPTIFYLQADLAMCHDVITIEAARCELALSVKLSIPGRLG